MLAFGEKSGVEPQHLDTVMQTMFSHPGLQEYDRRGEAAKRRAVELLHVPFESR